MDAEVSKGLFAAFSDHPITFAIMLTVIFVTVSISIFFLIKNAKSLKLGDFQVDFSKAESIKEEAAKDLRTREIAEAKRQVEERTRYTISRQFALVQPFLQSLRPIFNRLMFSILDDAMIDSLGIEKEQRKFKRKETIGESDGEAYYLVEEVKTYKNSPKTRAFTNLVESSVDSLLRDIQIEIYRMLVANNIGKCKEEVQAYVKSRSANLIGIVRNNLCDAYNQLSNKNLFDTHQYWNEIGITYPEDWISDQIYQLLKSCMQLRYSDFDA